MAIPRTILSFRAQQVENASGGLLWLALDGLHGDLPGSIAVVHADREATFMQGEKLPQGYRLLVQENDGETPAMLAYEVSFDDAFAALLAWTFGRDTWRQACDWRPQPRRAAPTKPPTLIRIAYEERRTEGIGRYADGQFLAFLSKRGLVFLFFDHVGNFVRYEGHKMPFEEALARRTELIAALDGSSYGDVAIRTFSVDIDGEAWRLVDETETHGYPRASLFPLDIMFDAPWDGLYDT